MFNTLFGMFPLITSLTSFATMIAASRWASLVDAAICGVNTTLSNVTRGLFSRGSFSYTSSPAFNSGLSFNTS